MEWYILRAGQTDGPRSFESLIEAAKQGELHKDDGLWCQGMTGWTSAVQVPGLWLPPLPADLPKQGVAIDSTETSDTSRPAPIEAELITPELDESALLIPSSGPGFLTRYWRGDVSLPVSYWAVGIGLTIAISLFSYGFEQFCQSSDLTPDEISLSIIAFIVFILACVVWQAVGLWRSASKYKKVSKTPAWGTVAQILLLLGVARTAGVFYQSFAPMMLASGKVLAGESTIPPYKFRLMNDGKELEISGGLPYGTSTALSSFLDAAPTVKIVHLNSVGGLIEEGKKVGRLIQTKGLSTYTATSCMSACTIAFLGGKQRFLSEAGRLGFHSASFGGLDAKDMPELNESMRNQLSAMGVPLWFINKTTDTSAKDMWFPTQQELLSAGVVNKVVSQSEYALSGIGDWQNPNVADEMLGNSAPYAALKQKDPASYAVLRQHVIDGIRKGSSSAALQQDIRTIFHGQILPKFFAAAPDPALLAYWRVQTDELRFAASSNPQGCVAYLFADSTSASPDMSSLFSKDLQERDLYALAQLIGETELSTGSVDIPTGNDDPITAVMVQLLKVHPELRPVFSKPKEYFTKPAMLCGAFVMFFDAIGQLPPGKAAPVVRKMLEKT
jgi:hypothetical protein